MLREGAELSITLERKKWFYDWENAIELFFSPPHIILKQHVFKNIREAYICSGNK